MFQQEGYKLMGAAFEVDNQLGYGLAEEVYQENLEIELGMRDIPFQTKHQLRLQRRVGMEAIYTVRPASNTTEH